MNKQARVGVIVVVVFLAVPFLLNLGQNWRASRDATTRDDQGQIVESGNLGVLVTKVGDCVLLPSSVLAYVRNLEGEDGMTLTQIQGVPCTELHDAEIVGEINFNDASYPGQEALLSRMVDNCISAYEDYTGASFSDSPHDVFPLAPTSESWAQGDRKGQCFAVNLEGKQLGASLRG